MTTPLQVKVRCEMLAAYLRIMEAAELSAWKGAEPILVSLERY